MTVVTMAMMIVRMMYVHVMVAMLGVQSRVAQRLLAAIANWRRLVHPVHFTQLRGGVRCEDCKRAQARVPVLQM
ncbi:MAG: hypothetical protein ACRD51_06605 [Candidatus Acidiferrum sp.]